MRSFLEITFPMPLFSVTKLPQLCFSPSDRGRKLTEYGLDESEKVGLATCDETAYDAIVGPRMPAKVVSEKSPVTT